MTVQDVTPNSVAQASVEDITWGFDTTALLSGSQTPTAATAALTSPQGLPVTLTDGPTVAANVISQRIRAGVLAAGHGTYTLIVTFTPSATSDVFAMRLTINVPF